MHSTSRNIPKNDLLTVSSLFSRLCLLLPIQGVPIRTCTSTIHQYIRRQVGKSDLYQRSNEWKDVCVGGCLIEGNRLDPYSRNTGLCHMLKRPECDPVHTDLRPFVPLFTKKLYKVYSNSQSSLDHQMVPGTEVGLSI